MDSQKFLRLAVDAVVRYYNANDGKARNTLMVWMMYMLFGAAKRSAITRRCCLQQYPTACIMKLLIMAQKMKFILTHINVGKTSA